MKKQIAILWSTAPGPGGVEVDYGTVAGSSSFDGNEENGRLELEIEADNLSIGKFPSIMRFCSERVAFSFFLRDVDESWPILIPGYEIAVTSSGDSRSYAQILDAIENNGLKTTLEQLEAEPEETFNAAARHTLVQKCQIWLGLSRDVRIFEVGLRQPMLYTDWIQPRFSGHGYFWKEETHMRLRYGFSAGRGWGCEDKVRRRLDGGVLPILKIERVDDEVRYDHICYASLEKSRLQEKNLRGTDYLVADGLSVCNALTEEQRAEFESRLETEFDGVEETVLCVRITAENTGSSPRHAFFKTIYPHDIYGNAVPHDYDCEAGFSLHKDSDEVFGISRIDGNPLGQPEIAVLLPPGGTTTLEFYIPHSPLSRERAAALHARDFDAGLADCRRFWRGKLNRAARIRVPEKRIDELIRAGHLHVDLVNYGREPDGPIAMANGTYSPIGSETSTIINYLDSLGLHDISRRCIAYYFEKQHENGFMQNFTGYMLETGCIMWLVGEHYRYTRDNDWLRSILPGVRKSVDFLLTWRARNQADEQKGGRFGLLEGKVADPEDDEIIFMLNGYFYLGLSRIAEVVSELDADEGGRLRDASNSLKEDILKAFRHEQARGPAVPLSDGTWCPTVAPWLGRSGPSSLFTDDGNWWTHGAVNLRDDSLGPLILIYHEIVEANEQAADFLVNSDCELYRSRNTSFSQPYLARHQYAHLYRGEAKAFLKAYYNALTALIDRETYSWWEHFYHEAPHKIGEEGQFLMHTRLMLYMEQGNALYLLRCVPRAWLEDGKKIALEGVASYFGKLDVHVQSRVAEGVIEASISCDPDRRPDTVVFRLPHPEEKRATSVEGGDYNADSEEITIEKFTGEAKVVARYS